MAFICPCIFPKWMHASAQSTLVQMKTIIICLEPNVFVHSLHARGLKGNIAKMGIHIHSISYYYSFIFMLFLTRKCFCRVMFMSLNALPML